MIPAQFDYVRAGSVDEAVAALAERGDDAKVLAGGQSLIPLLRLRMSYPEVLVDVGRVDEMRGVREDGDHLVIGAMTTHHDVLHDPLVRQYAGLVASGDGEGRRPGHPAPRDVRRVARPRRPGGRPAGGRARARRRARRGRTVRPSDDRRLRTSSSTTCRRRSSRTSCWSRCGCPSSVRAGASTTRSSTGSRSRGPSSASRRRSSATNGGIAQARIALTNMGSTPLRASGDRGGAGRRRRRAASAAAAEHAAEGTSPPSDLNGKADYREHLARVLTRRAVTAAAGWS